MFPYWFGKHDPRNRNLLQAFPAIKSSVAQVIEIYQGALQYPVQTTQLLIMLVIFTALIEKPFYSAAHKGALPSWD